MLITAAAFAGCSTTTTPPPHHTDSPPPSNVESGSPVAISVMMPKEVTLGEEFTYEIKVTASQSLGNVMVSDSLQNGTAYVSGEPKATVDGEHLRWNLGDLDKGQSATIRAVVKPSKEGTLSSCATVSADPRACATIFVGKAALSCDLSAQESSVVGAAVTFTYTVANKGSMAAKNVRANVQLPDGLISVTDQRQISIEVGDLAPNETKKITGAVKGVQKGKFTATIKTTSNNAGECEANFALNVLQPALKFTMDGMKEQFLTRVANYKLVVSNVGDTPITNIAVTDSAPADTTVASAAGGSVNGSQVVWNVGTLQPGEEKTLPIGLTSAVSGSHCNSAKVTFTEGAPMAAEACTVWSGLGALGVEFNDNPDPIRIDEETLYTVHVTNQGTAALNNIKTTAVFDGPNSPVTASAGTVDGQTVTFPSVRTLGPKESFTYTVRVKGVKAGNALNKVTISTDEFPQPVVTQESLRVF